MSEFFLELFSEEIPVNLQKNAREILLQNFKDFFKKENIVFSEKSFSFSTPNRVLILFNRLNKEVIKKSEEIRGPNINAPEKALDGFLRSNSIAKEAIFKKKTDKGEFYFYKKTEEKTNTFDLLEKNLSLPAYDQCLKASHIFNILDARGVISVAQRTEYISRIREITKGAGEIWLKSQTE